MLIKIYEKDSLNSISYKIFFKTSCYNFFVSKKILRVKEVFY